MDLFSEPFSLTGNVSGGGVQKLLGRPSLSPLQIMLREALQNVVDAAIPGETPSVLLRLRTLSTDQQDDLTAIFNELPTNQDSRRKITQAIHGESLRVLEICDYQTVGLTGPTRADVVPTGDERPNFVNFLRNIGAERSDANGAGTYGYGKSSLYLMSRCSTVLVDSQTSEGGRAVRRLMACHLGSEFDHENRRYTGRHWWGALQDDFIEPVTGELAKLLSQKVGFPRRTKLDSGTTICIIDPDLNGSNADIAREIVESVLWNFWPRLCATTPDDRRLRVEVEIDGEKIETPNPEDFPPLDVFASALAKLHDNSVDAIDIASRKPIKHLGRLAFSRGMRADRYFPVKDDSIIPQQAHHVALLRPVHLVVTYLEGPSTDQPSVEWGGVFICDDDAVVERAFADAEPPTHDDWNYEFISDPTRRSYVRVAMRNIREHIVKYATPNSILGSDSQQEGSLAQLSSILGKYLQDTSNSGPGRGGSRARKRTIGRRQSENSAPKFEKLIEHGEETLAVFTLNYRCTSDKSVLTLIPSYLGGDDTDEMLEPPEIHAAVHVESKQRLKIEDFKIANSSVGNDTNLSKGLLSRKGIRLPKGDGKIVVWVKMSEYAVRLKAGVSSIA